MLDLRQKTVSRSGGRLEAIWLECVERREGWAKKAGRRQVFEHRSMASPRVIQHYLVAEQKLLDSNPPLVHRPAALFTFARVGLAWRCPCKQLGAMHRVDTMRQSASDGA